MIEEFCPRWAPSGRVLYVGGAAREDPLFETDALGDLGIRLDKHGKLPDLIVHLPSRDWLVLLEAASSHGPVDGKRHGELHDCSDPRGRSRPCELFPGASGDAQVSLGDRVGDRGLVCRCPPSHLIHFNGERFLGPYSQQT